MGNTTNLPQSPNYTDVGSLSQYQSTWGNMLSHIDELMKDGNAAGAIQYITTSLFTFLGYFSEEYQMGQESNYENLLSYIGQYENAMQDDFNEIKDADYTTPTQNGNTAAVNIADDAQIAYRQIIAIINDDGSNGGPNYKAMISSIGGDLQNELWSTTAGYVDKGQDLVNYWEMTVWPPKNIISTTPNNISPVTNAFTAISNDISSQSSVAQSEMKYYEANDEQYKSMDHDIMTELVNGEKTAVQAAQNASN